MFDRRPWLGALLLAIVTCGAYLPAWRGEFLWDDDAYVRDNLTLRSPDGLLRIWTTLDSTPQYYPLTFTTFWIEHQLWGLDPLGYHLVNIGLHVVNAVLAWRILLRLGVPGAFWAAALFALHPVHVESVAWITERKNVLSGCFYLAAMRAWFGFAPPEAAARPAKLRWGCYIGAELFFLLALLSKTVTATLPAALLLLAWYRRGSVSLREILWLLPFFLWGAVLGGVTSHLESSQVGAGEATSSEWNLSLGERVFIASRGVWFYAAKLVFPYPLAFFYERWEIDTSSLAQALFPLLTLAVLGLFFGLRDRLGRGPITAMLYFVGTLGPALGFVNFYPMRFSFVADHFQYLASLGVLALVAGSLTRWLAQAAPEWIPVHRLGAASVAALLAVLTFVRAGVFASPALLWADAVEQTPNSWAARLNHGYQLTRQDRLDLAEVEFAAAHELYPDAAEPLVNLAMILEKKGEDRAAVDKLVAAVGVEPRNPEANLRLGRQRLLQGDHAAARQHLETAVDSRPNHYRFQYWLGYVCLRAAERLKDDARIESLASAVRALSRAAYLNPQYFPALRDLGTAHTLLSDYQLAEQSFRRALALQPDVVGVHAQLAHTLMLAGQAAAGLAEYREAERLAPNLPGVLVPLTRILAAHPDPDLRSGKEALRYAERLLAQVSPASSEYPERLDLLAAAQAESGDFVVAAETVGKAQAAATNMAEKLAADPSQQPHQQRFAQLAAIYQQRTAQYRNRQPLRLDLKVAPAVPVPASGPDPE